MKVKIDNSTYIVLLVSFLAGYFEYMYLFLLTIFIHEAGHVIFGSIIGFKYSKIIIYPFGGLTLYNEDLNVSSNKELFSLIGGIVFQLLFYFLIVYLYRSLFITNHVFVIIRNINTILISFNFLPILPLDGGRLLNIITDKLFPYRISNIICISISIIFIVIFQIVNKTYISLILSIFLIKCTIMEINKLKYKYNLFLLERYINNYKFKKIRCVKDINCFKRDFYHYINDNSEKYLLYKLFNK